MKRPIIIICDYYAFHLLFKKDYVSINNACFQSRINLNNAMGIPILQVNCNTLKKKE